MPFRERKILVSRVSSSFPVLRILGQEGSIGFDWAREMCVGESRTSARFSSIFPDIDSAHRLSCERSEEAAIACLNVYRWQCSTNIWEFCCFEHFAVILDVFGIVNHDFLTDWVRKLRVWEMICILWFFLRLISFHGGWVCFKSGTLVVQIKAFLLSILKCSCSMIEWMDESRNGRIKWTCILRVERMEYWRWKVELKRISDLGPALKSSW